MQSVSLFKLGPSVGLLKSVRQNVRTSDAHEIITNAYFIMVCRFNYQSSTILALELKTNVTNYVPCCDTIFESGDYGISKS